MSLACLGCTSTATSDAFAGKAPIEGAVSDLLAMFGGLQ